ncbi:MAG: UDP-3-O-(3-hydroxymyristoyl)glucosamine N-acyltransferase [Acetobacteraceae bacterium]
MNSSGRDEAAGDPRFYEKSGPHPLAAVAAAAGGEVADGERLLQGVAPLQSAGPQEVSFFDSPRYAAALSETRAGAVIVRRDMQQCLPQGVAAIVVEEPLRAWARVAALFHPLPPWQPGIHASAIVAEDAIVDVTAEVGPLAVVGRGAEVGPRSRIGPGAVIGEGVALAADCRIGASASVSYALLGERVSIHPGARIGQEGFGFAIGEGGFVSAPQLGRVILEHDVEIGANCTIDRGSLQDTVIGAGTRLDNLVHIGHNVRIGRLCVIVAQVGISGSTVVEDFVMIGGQAGLAGHLHVGRKARIGAQAGVMADVAAGARIVGSPAERVRTIVRQLATLRRLSRKESRCESGATKHDTN